MIVYILCSILLRNSPVELAGNVRHVYNFADSILEVQSIEVVGNTVEVTVRLPGSEKITVVLRDINENRQSKQGTELLTKF